MLAPKITQYNLFGSQGILSVVGMEEKVNFFYLQCYTDFLPLNSEIKMLSGTRIVSGS